MKANAGYIYQKGTTPNTKTAISSKVKIFSYSYDHTRPVGHSDWIQVGVVASFAPTQGRGAEPVRGIGYGDQIAELVPNVSDPVTISVERACLYLANMFQVFGYAGGADGLVRGLKHHRWPFDIRQEMVLSELEADLSQEWSNQDFGGESVDDHQISFGDPAISQKFLLTVYLACWMTSYNYTVASDTTMISESVDISVTDIRDSSNSSQYVEEMSTGLAWASEPLRRDLGAGSITT